MADTLQVSRLEVTAVSPTTLQVARLEVTAALNPTIQVSRLEVRAVGVVPVKIQVSRLEATTKPAEAQATFVAINGRWVPAIIHSEIDGVWVPIDFVPGVASIYPSETLYPSEDLYPGS